MTTTQTSDTASALWKAYDDAQRGSELLLYALREQFLNFALKHRVGILEAQVRCMNSTGGPR